MPIHLLHTIPSIALSDGGPSQAIRNIERALEISDVKITTVSTDHNLQLENQGHSIPLGQLIKKSAYIYRIYFRKQIHFYKISFPMVLWLWRNVRRYDIVHIHALFSFSSVVAAWIAMIKQVPYIVRPLGVLNRYGMIHRRRWIKALSFRWIETPILRNAAAVHFTSQQEAYEATELMPNIKSKILPLGIDIESYRRGRSDNFFNTYPETKGKKLILFLSRIDPKKGLDILIPAFAAIHPFHKDSLLVIAGDGQRSYVESLKALAASLALKNEILWTGFLSGQEKLDALAAAHVFVLPSQSENFGIAAVEALAAGLPVITGKGVAISEAITDYGAGYVVDAHNTKDYAQALRKALTGDLTPLRQAALKLAQEQFSLEKMGANLVALYHSILETK